MFVFLKKGIREIHEIKPGLILLITISGILQALCPFINIFMSAKILNALVDKKEMQYLLLLVSITVFLDFFALLILNFLNHLLNLWKMEFNSIYEMRLSFKLTEMDYADVENPRIHNLRQKINELKSINGSGIFHLLNCHANLIKYGFVVIFSVFMILPLFFSSKKILITDWLSFIDSVWVSLLLFVFIIFNVIINLYSSTTVTKKMYLIMNGLIPFNRVFGYYMENYISNYHAGKEIRIYNQASLISSELKKLFTDVDNVTKRLSRNQTKFATLTAISSILVSILIYLFVGTKALLGIYSIGMIVQYISSINEFTNGFTNFINEFSKLKTNNEALSVYFDYMKIPSNTNQGELLVDENNGYTIEFVNVSFCYPESNAYALKNVNFRCEMGEKIALVGENGSGKTTFIKLLCRMYDPTEGTILLNGVDIKEYEYKEYMKLFSVVFQDFNLLSFSLAQNISISDNGDLSLIEQCLKIVGFEERLLKMPDGVFTNLYKDFDESGVEISGGEAQKIALARALYKNSPFVVLDEPTAALDPIAEAEIYARFDEIIDNKMAIYISHRLSSCKFCDLIYVFENGSITQKGTHENLINMVDGKYHKLWNAQAQYYRD